MRLRLKKINRVLDEDKPLIDSINKVVHDDPFAKTGDALLAAGKMARSSVSSKLNSGKEKI